MATQLDSRDWTDELDSKEVQDSLQVLLSKLPDLVSKLEQADRVLAFGEAVMKDERTIETIKTKIDQTNLSLDTLEAAVRLLEKLPMLLELIERIEPLIAFADNVLSDKQSIEYLQSSVEEYVEPIREKADKGKALWKETQLNAEMNTQHISIFTVLKWMKDPSVQKGLSYMQGFIEALPKSKR